MACIVIWEWSTRAPGPLALLTIIRPRADPVYRHIIVWPMLWFPNMLETNAVFATQQKFDVFDRSRWRQARAGDLLAPSR